MQRAITSHTDLWEPLDPAAVSDWETWRYDREPNLQDSLITSFVPNLAPANQPPSTCSLSVEGVQADAYGGATIMFTDNCRLVIFPAGSRGEDWRIFQPGTNTSHVVIAGGLIE